MISTNDGGRNPVNVYGDEADDIFYCVYVMIRRGKNTGYCNGGCKLGKLWIERPL